MKILVTGFEPFGGDTKNVSWEAVRRLPAVIDGAEIISACLPVSYDRVEPELWTLAERFSPDAVLCVGLAGNRDCLTPEQTAVNLMASKIPDNDGVQYGGQKIRPAGLEYRPSPLPAAKIAQAMVKAGVPARVSPSAGTFVCNRVMYGLLDGIAAGKGPKTGGFLHVPREEAVPLEKICQGLEIEIREIVRSLK